MRCEYVRLPSPGVCATHPFPHKLERSHVQAVRPRVGRSLDAGASSSSSLGQRPRLGADDLAFAICPEVDDHADHVVDGSIGSLVE